MSTCTCIVCHGGDEERGSEYGVTIWFTIAIMTRLEWSGFFFPGGVLILTTFSIMLMNRKEFREYSTNNE
jgi:hypothetical protein